MGKKDVKREGRVKGNLQPAASSRAAELMSSGFGGFGGLAPTSFGMGGEDFTDVDTELKVIFKKLAKRDSVTRIKGLEELSAYVDGASVEDIQKMLPAWPKLYNRLGTDVDRRVRENTGQAHLALVRKARKQLAPVLKELIGTWLILRFDPAKDAAKAAAEAFQEAFPNKQADVLTFCQTEILQFLTEHLLNTTPETLSDPRFITPEDMTARFARVISSCLYTLGWMLDAIESRLSTIAPAFVGKIFTEKEASNQSDMWEALVTLLRAFSAAWDVANQKKPVLPKLCSFLKNGAYGSIGISYPSLLPFISVLPAQVLSEEKFQQEFLNSFWAGLNSNAIDLSHSKAFIDAYLECGMFLLIKSGFETEASRQILDIHLFRPVELLLTPSKHANVKEKLKADVLEISVADFILKLGRSTQVPAQSSAAFLSHVRDTAAEQIDMDSSSDGEPTFGDYELMCTRATSLWARLGEGVKRKEGERVPLADEITSAAKTLFSKGIESLSEDNLDGLSTLLCSLAESYPQILFTDPKCHDLLLQMCEVKLPEMEKVDPPVLGRLFKTSIVCMGVISGREPGTCTKLWNGLLDVLARLDEEHRSVVFNDVLVELRQIELDSSYDLRSDRLDVAVLLLLDHGADPDGEQKRANESALALALESDRPIISNNAYILAGQNFVITLANVQTSNPEKHIAPARFTLNVLERLLKKGMNVSSMFDVEMQKDLLLSISELATFDLPALETVHQLDQVKKAALGCWKAYISLASKGNDDEVRTVVELLLDHWK
ncbi:listerin E3 ubiquitin protein ligase 1, partial [Rhizophlyctis rosea]